MKIQRMFKFALPALLLAAGISAYAAEPEGKVTLGNGNTVTWAEFAKVINNPASVEGAVPSDIVEQWENAQEAYAKAAEAVSNAQNELDSAQEAVPALTTAATDAQKKYDDASKNLNSWQAERTTLIEDRDTYNYQIEELKKDITKVTAPWLTIALDKVSQFQAAYNATSTTGPTIYYHYEFDSTDDTGTLTLSFDNKRATELNLTEISTPDLYKFLVTENKPADFIYIDLGKNEQNIPNYGPTNGNGIFAMLGPRSTKSVPKTIKTNLENLVSTNMVDTYTKQDEITKLEGDVKKLNNQIATLTTSIKTLTDKDENGKTELDKLLEASQAAKVAKDNADNAVTQATLKLSNAKKALETATTNQETAQKVYDDALAEAQEKILAPYMAVTLNSDVTADTVIDNYNGIIRGNGHTITIASTLVAPESTTKYIFNDFSGTLIGVGINAVSGSFALTQSTPKFNRVAYWNGTSGTYYDESANKSTARTLGELGFIARQDFGADFANNKLVPRTDESIVYDITIYESNSSIQRYVTKDNGTSQFIDQDGHNYNIPVNKFAESKTPDLKDIPNVVYNKKCDKAIITDRKEFFCPYDIEATEIEYDREFIKGPNAVCLPFELKYDYVPTGTHLCTYDRETSNDFIFTRTAEKIDANTPLLVDATDVNGPFKLTNVTGTIKQTPAIQIVYNDALDHMSQACGIFKQAKRGQINGESQGYKVYGLTSGENPVFKAAGENSVFPALRMVIYSEIGVEQGAPRRIVLLDENGNEINHGTTAIESVENEASSLSVIGGQGEITITSEADYGQVAIYSINGSVAATANVMVGTTTVNLQQGIYIVMGKKVVVK